MTARVPHLPPPEPAVLAPRIVEAREIPLIMASLAGLGLLVLVLPTGSVAFAFPRVTLLGCLIGALLTMRDSRYALPAFLILLAPLRVIGVTIRLGMGEYPITPVTLALLALAVTAVVFRWRLSPSLRSRSLGSTVVWVSIIAAAVPVLWPAQTDDARLTVTRLIFVTGTLEPLLLFVLALAWLRTYRDIRLFLIALVTSYGCGLLTGLVLLRTVEFSAFLDNISILRFNLSGFGGANTAGFITVLFYPLALAFPAGRPRDFVQNVVPILALTWGMALGSFSRSTPVIMVVQTVIYFVWSPSRTRAAQTVAVVGLVVVATVAFAPSDLRQTFLDRFLDTDTLGVLLGSREGTSDNDDSRLQTRESLVDVIKTRPWGGFAAVGLEDPENLYLDIALQLGWAPAFGFLCLQVLLLRLTWQAAHAPHHATRTMNRLLSSSLLGSVIYGATTGVNLVKVGLPRADELGVVGFQFNNMPVLFFAAVAALATFATDLRYQAAARR